MVQIVLNGEQREVPRGLTVATLLRHLHIDASRIAVEIDRQIVRRRDWDSTLVRAAAVVEVVQFVGGG